SLALAHTTLELPPANGGSYYEISAVTIHDASGNAMNLLSSAWVGNNVATSAGASCANDYRNAATNGQFITLGDVNTQSATLNANLRKMALDPDYNFGLAFVTNEHFTYPVVDGSDCAGVLAGTTDYSQSTGFTHTNLIEAGAVNVRPTMDIYLTYNPALTNTILRDITFTLKEIKEGCNDGAPIDVTVSIATIVPEFTKFEVSTMAMYNEGIANEYSAKVILPATFQRRELELEYVQWHCATDHNPDMTGCYGDNHLFHLVDMETAGSADNVLNITNNPTNFGMIVSLSNATGDESNSTLGWYDIPASSESIDIVKLVGATTSARHWSYGTDNDDINCSSPAVIATSCSKKDDDAMALYSTVYADIPEVTFTDGVDGVQTITFSPYFINKNYKFFNPSVK
ncbi:MAG: hypothetical protein HUJ63_07050, partial [Enterococcus sp.]|nr:hypothetical protein [Enterococcus sp.]